MEQKSIISSIPGIFYRKPSPEQDPFVEEGQAVKSGDTIGLIEVMKSFFEIKAENDGILEKFTLGNEDMVEAGQTIAFVAVE